TSAPGPGGTRAGSSDGRSGQPQTLFLVPLLPLPVSRLPPIRPSVRLTTLRVMSCRAETAMTMGDGGGVAGGERSETPRYFEAGRSPAGLVSLVVLPVLSPLTC